jgi:hypothetical protein
MAKLSKTGTTIHWQLGKERPLEDGGKGITRYAFRSDGALLSKYIVVRPGYRHDYGWKVAYKKVKADPRNTLEAKGYSAEV